MTPRYAERTQVGVEGADDVLDDQGLAQVATAATAEGGGDEQHHDPRPDVHQLKGPWTSRPRSAPRTV